MRDRSRHADPSGHYERTDPSPEEGSAALLVLSGALVVMVVLLALADIGIFLMTRARAQVAADAAALAAAQELIPGLGADPREQAAWFAQANGARLTSCECSFGERAALVRVESPARFILLSAAGVRNVTARARAEVELPGPRR